MKSVQVRDPSSRDAVRHINELEYINGYIYANIWYVILHYNIFIYLFYIHIYIYEIIWIIFIWYNNRYTKIIIKINPVTGDIVKKYDFSDLPTYGANIDSFNGIAYCREEGLFILTGKYWPRYYFVTLDEDN